MADSADSETTAQNEVVEQPGNEQDLEEASLLEDSEMLEEENTEKTVDESKAESEVAEISLAVSEGDTLGAVSEGDVVSAVREGDAEVTYLDEEAEEGNEAEGDELKVEEESATKEDGEEAEEEDEEDDAEEEEAAKQLKHADPNVMPQVNVAVLAKRKWQVKVYPLKPADFVSGQISRVFKNAKESLLYILSPGKYARGKGEMYISSVNQTVRVVQNLMKLDFQYPEINIEVVKKNSEGVIEEKAYMRFDTKMVRMLCVPALPPRRLGNKRERVIGSVFVKNLPNNTSKDMLRVMFPFAPEINYNPEKFKDGTARLVLNNRNAVVPCLKAFAKVELGGNILELHPLEKRKKNSESTESSSGGKHHERTDSENRKREESKKETGGKSESESKESGSHHDEKEKTPKDGERKDSKAQAGKKEPPKKSPGSSKLSDDKATGLKIQEIKKRVRHRWNQGRKAGLIGGQERRKVAALAGKSDSAAGGFPRGNRSDVRRGSTSRDGGDSRSSRFQQDRNRGNRSGGIGGRNAGNRNDRFGRRGSSSGAGGGRSRFGSGGGFGRRNRGFDNRMMKTGFGASVSDVNAEVATKEMMLLQNQLSMAIKNQLTMLNQTQLAVEQAKRGAGGVGLGREGRSSGLEASGSGGGHYGKRVSDQYSMAQLAAEQARRGPLESGRDRQYGNRSRSRDRGADVDGLGMVGGGYGYKRGADVAGLQDYGTGGAGYGKRRSAGMAGQQQGASSWAEERGAGLYGSPQQQFGYAVDREVDDRAAEFGSLPSRSFNPNSLNYGYQY